MRFSRLLRFPSPPILHKLVAAILALLSSQAGFQLLILPDRNAAVVWIASGIAIALVAILGLQILPGLFVGYAISYLIHYSLSPVGILTAFVIALVSTGEVALGGWILRRFTDSPPWLGKLRDVFIFIGIVAIVPPILSATLGGLILCITAHAPWEIFWQVWRTWAVGNTAGTFIATPFILTWSEGPPNTWLRSKYQVLELAFLLGGAITLAHITFAQTLSLEYFLLPLLAWIAYRFNRQAVTLSIAVVSAIAIGEIVTGMVNRFENAATTHTLTSFQLFLCVIILTILTFSTVLYERKKAQFQLKQYNQKLEQQVQNRTLSLQESETALQKQKAFLRQVIDTNPNVIFVKDAQGHFILVNQALARVYETSIENLIGKTDADFNPNAREVEQFNETDRQILSSGETRHFEETVTSPNGRVYHFQTIKTPLWLPDSQESYLLGVAAEISERKKVESELENARQAAEAANRTKSKFLAAMSHELRTPLNGVLGYAQLLRRSSSIGQSDRHNVEVIEECGSHLLTLINDILELSQVELQKLQLHPSKFHLPSLLTRIVHLYQFQATRKKITFTYEPDPQLPEAVVADEKRLRQVLTNLLDNTVKFTEVGNVTFRVSILEPPTAQQQHETNIQPIRFQIQDTGVGIDADQIAQIFQPFEQIGELNQKSEGTGLGLSLSQKIVNLMGGEIQVISELGVGSTFWFDVDFSLVQSSSRLGIKTHQGHVTGYQGYTRCLLLVDAQPENRATIAHLLSPLGFEIVEAQNTTTGLQRARELMPDLIVTNCMLPDSDRFGLVRQIRQTNYLAHVPIFVSTNANGYQKSDRRQTIEAGGNDFLAQPIDPSELLQKLAKHLQLQWIYQEKFPETETTTEIDETTLIVPASAEIEALYELTLKGSFKKIQKRVESLQQQDSQFAPFCQKVLQFARAFGEQELLEFLGNYRSSVERSPKS